MKKYNSKWKCYLTMMVLLTQILPANIHCQDFILTIPYEDHHSIIRKIDTDNNLIYNHGKDNRFYKIDFSTGTGFTMSLLGKDNMKILDFEIFDDYVFFCGMEDTLSPNAVFGYFTLGNFPSSTIYYDVRDEWASFNKLDIFKVDGEYHVVMTATYHNGFGTMMDVRGNVSGVWTYCEADLRNERWHFYDVAVTKEYIVYTSTGDKDEMITKSNPGLWYIKKPIISGVAIFNNIPGDMVLGELKIATMGDILIEHIKENEIAIVHRSDMYDFKVSYLDALYYQRTILVSCNDDCIIKDIKNGIRKNEVEVLTNYNTSIKSVLYSVPYTVPGPTCSVNFKYPIYTNEVINSIDLNSFFGYVGSGHDTWSYDLHAYHIAMIQSGTCFYSFDITELVEEFLWEKQNKIFPHWSYTYDIGTIAPDSAPLGSDIHCE